MNAPANFSAHPGHCPQPVAELTALFEAQRRISRAQAPLSLAERRERLGRLQRLIDTHASALAAAVEADFGVRSAHVTEVADFFVLRATLGQLQRQLGRWMKPQRVGTPLYLWPARAHIQRQPLGVVGIIGPWNYPLQLTLGPLAAALAAGNRVMLKPSELTPRTSALLAQLLHQAFPPEEVVVVQGGAAVAQAFADVPFDHLFFTGSTEVGRKVAQAAARHLTPTTLELGGKSPCIVDASCDLADVALKIAHGKLFNAGQTCIAPDYVWLPRGLEEAFTQAMRGAVARLFGVSPLGNPDYASIASDRHHQRLHALLDEARALGADVRPLLAQGPACPPTAHERQFAPVLVFRPPAHSRLMREEIFGPLLPVLTYEHLDEVVAHINAHPRPLALYWFGRDPSACKRVLTHTVSGGVTVNDTLMHIAHKGLPFGGVGDSGWGAYHGEVGFLRFSHQKAVFVQSRWAQGQLFYPPYGPGFERLTAWLRRLL
jgi:coniferyl-aldehyde dehydrogenase